MDTYTKEAEISEYEHHKLFSESGINVPDIASYDEERKQLSTVLIIGTVVSDSRYSKNQSRDVCLKLITQVEKLHKLGYLHGDLNPSNVVISDNKEVYLIDFEFPSEIGANAITEDAQPFLYIQKRGR